MDHFPSDSPRPQQVRALEYIERARASGYKDVVIEAPTGVGKSLVAVAAASWGRSISAPDGVAPGGYVLVHQKALQDQIEADAAKFGADVGARVMKGAVEYPCPMAGKCSAGARRKCDCRRMGSCPYKMAKALFVAGSVGITNYAYFLEERRFVGEVKNRAVLCLDEVHNLLNVVTTHVGLNINATVLKEYAPVIDPEDLGASRTLVEFAKWVGGTYVPAVMDQVAILSGEIGDDQALRRAADVERHGLRARAFSERINKHGPEGWVFWREEEESAAFGIHARPLTGAGWFDQLFPSVSIRVHLSAYPGTKGTYCRDLGLEPDKVAWLKMGSPFPAANRSVYLYSVGSMSRDKQSGTLPGVLRTLERLVDRHDERGIIHTHTYALANAIVDHLQSTPHAPRVVFPRHADERAAAIERHAREEGSVLVSPSLGEGYDFPGDRSRWQILIKAPFPSLSSRWVEERLERDRIWYSQEAFKAFLQCCGRSVRGIDDYASTYCLDSDFERLLEDNRQFAPKWFLESILRT